nr:antibiotic biosynthesis protein AlbB [uncultured Bacillus sp.]
MSENQRKVLLAIIAIIFFAGSIIYFIKGNLGFAIFSLIVGIIFGIRAGKAVNR